MGCYVVFCYLYELCAYEQMLYQTLNVVMYAHVCAYEPLERWACTSLSVREDYQEVSGR